MRAALRIWWRYHADAYDAGRHSHYQPRFFMPGQRAARPHGQGRGCLYSRNGRAASLLLCAVRYLSLAIIQRWRGASLPKANLKYNDNPHVHGTSRAKPSPKILGGKRGFRREKSQNEITARKRGDQGGKGIRARPAPQSEANFTIRTEYGAIRQSGICPRHQ